MMFLSFYYTKTIRFNDDRMTLDVSVHKLVHVHFFGSRLTGAICVLNGFKGLTDGSCVRDITDPVQVHWLKITKVTFMLYSMENNLSPNGTLRVTFLLYLRCNFLWDLFVGFTPSSRLLFSIQGLCVWDFQWVTCKVQHKHLKSCLPT